jgi:hypothetical protein
VIATINIISHSLRTKNATEAIYFSVTVLNYLTSTQHIAKYRSSLGSQAEPRGLDSTDTTADPKDQPWL